MLNNLFNFTDGYDSNKYSYTHMKKNSKYTINIYMVFYNFVEFFSNIFQNILVIIYSANIQLNRLPFRILPNVVKRFFIDFVSLEN